VLRLIKLWLKAPIEEGDGDGRRRIVGGKRNKRGTPQGGVASPLLANIYMNRFLKHWASNRTWRSIPCPRRLLCRRLRHPQPRLCGGRALAWTKAVMTRLGLTPQRGQDLAEGRPSGALHVPCYSFGPHWYKANGQWYLGTSPSKKSVQRLKTTVGNLLVPGNNAHGRKCATR